MTKYSVDSLGSGWAMTFAYIELAVAIFVFVGAIICHFTKPDIKARQLADQNRREISAKIKAEHEAEMRKRAKRRSSSMRKPQGEAKGTPAVAPQATSHHDRDGSGGTRGYDRRRSEDRSVHWSSVAP